MPLTATIDPGHHQFVTDNVYFYMNNGDRQVRCGITRSALEVLAPELPHTKQGRVQAFKQRRAEAVRRAVQRHRLGERDRNRRPLQESQGRLQADLVNLKARSVLRSPGVGIGK